MAAWIICPLSSWRRWRLACQSSLPRSAAFPKWWFKTKQDFSCRRAMSPRWPVQLSVFLTKSAWRGVLASMDSSEPRNYSRSKRMCALLSRSLIPTTTTPRTHEAPKSCFGHPETADSIGLVVSLQGRTAEPHRSFVGAVGGACFAHFIGVANVASPDTDGIGVGPCV